MANGKSRKRRGRYGAGYSIYDHPTKPGCKRGEMSYIDPETGKERTKYFTGVSHTQCVRLIEEFRAELKLKREQVESRASNPLFALTVGEFITQWWSACKPAYRKTTAALHQSTLNTHILGTDLCDIELTRFCPDDVVAFLNAKRQEGASENVLSRCYKLLHAIFQMAVEEGKLVRNPAALPKMKKPRKVRRAKVVCFPAEYEAKLLCYAAALPFWSALIPLAFDSGCREAELLGLQKQSLNLVRRELFVAHTLNTAGTETHLEPIAKTSSSLRRVYLAKGTVDALRSHLKAVFEQGTFVFLDADGQPWKRGNFHKAWTRLLKAAGLPHYPFHACRHTCATRLLKGGAYLPAVSKRLGHAKPSITLDIYSDYIPDDQHLLADAFDATLKAYRGELLTK
jgi:integrase